MTGHIIGYGGHKSLVRVYDVSLEFRCTHTLQNAIEIIQLLPKDVIFIIVESV